MKFHLVDAMVQCPELFRTESSCPRAYHLLCGWVYPASNDSYMLKHKCSVSLHQDKTLSRAIVTSKLTWYNCFTVHLLPMPNPLGSSLIGIALGQTSQWPLTYRSLISESVSWECDLRDSMPGLLLGMGRNWVLPSPWFFSCNFKAFSWRFLGGSVVWLLPWWLRTLRDQGWSIQSS